MALVSKKRPAEPEKPPPSAAKKAKPESEVPVSSPQTSERTVVKQQSQSPAYTMAAVTEGRRSAALAGRLRFTDYQTWY